MSLLGQGVLVNWGGVLAEAEADYNAWHSLEHMPERIAVPGFSRGRRAVALEGTPTHRKYFMMYEVASPDVLVSAAYLARLNDPTPWTQRILATYVMPSRTVCRVIASEGIGTGGYIGTIHMAYAAHVEHAFADAHRIRSIMSARGVLAFHVLRGDSSLGQQPTIEKRFRESQGEPDRTVGTVLLIEGLDLETTAAALAELESAVAKEAATDVVSNLYRTQHVVVRADVDG